MTLAALIFIAWWFVLIFAWAMCRSAALGDRRLEQLPLRHGTGSDPFGPVSPEDDGRLL